MTDEQIEKAGDAYVLKRMLARNPAKSETKSALCDFDLRSQMWDGFDMAQAYTDGIRDAIHIPQWTNVGDALPEVGLIVLVFAEDVSRGRYVYGLAHYDGEKWCNAENYKQIRPIYWMDFPDAPKRSS